MYFLSIHDHFLAVLIKNFHALFITETIPAICLFEQILMIQGVIKSWRPLVSFNFISYRKHDIQYKGENYMEFCDDVYTTSNKIRSLCFFAIFHTGISALEIFSLMCVIYLAFLEFNYSDTHKKKTQKGLKIPPKMKILMVLTINLVFLHPYISFFF